MHYRNSSKEVNSINFDIYKVIMAIPFFNHDAEEEEIIVESVQEVAVISQSESEQDIVQEIVEKDSSFVGKLLRELVDVYLRMGSNNRSRTIPISSGRRRVTNISRIVNVPPTQPPNATSKLPDLLCCHAQNLHPIPNEKDDVTTETLPKLPINNRQRNSLGPRTPSTQTSLLGPVSTDDNDDLNSELSLDVKMNIEFCYKRIGQDLRQVADRFETTSSRPRCRHPAGNHSSKTEITLKSELAIKIAIPVALFSLGLAFLKKSM